MTIYRGAPEAGGAGLDDGGARHFDGPANASTDFGASECDAFRDELLNVALLSATQGPGP